jgi:DNA ligase-1
MSLKEAFETFEKIEATSSRLEKEALIKSQLNNETFKDLLNSCYDPYSIFGIKKIPKVQTKDTPTEENSLRFNVLLSKLVSRKITGNVAVNAVTEFFENCNALEYKWYSRVLTKDLKIGITEKTINKVFPDLIPEFSAMLAQPLKDFPDEFICDPKLDGYRCLAFHYNDSNVILLTRNGKQIIGYEAIEADIKKLPKGFVYDGEIMSKSGSFADTQKDVFRKDTIKEGILNIFDAVSIREFEGVATTKYKDRLIWITTNIKDSNNIKVVERSEFLKHNMSDINKLYEYHNNYVARGFEGTMIKDLNEVYLKKRTNAVQKMKDMDTLDLPVIDIFEGQDKYTGMLGGLIVDFQGNSVRIGTGFTDSMRKTLWESKTDLVNRIIEVKYQEITSNQQGGQSLRFPVFVGFRDDK